MAGKVEVLDALISVVPDSVLQMRNNMDSTPWDEAIGAGNGTCASLIEAEISRRAKAKGDEPTTQP